MLAFYTTVSNLFKQLASYVTAHPVRFIILVLVIALGVTYCQNQHLEHQVGEAKAETKNANQAATAAKATTDFVATDAQVKEQVNLKVNEETLSNNQRFDEIDAELKTKLVALDQSFKQADKYNHTEIKSLQQTAIKPLKNSSGQPGTSASFISPPTKMPAVTTAADLNTQKATIIIDSLWATYDIAVKAGHP